MAEITIDGLRLEVERGTTVIQAADQLGIEIPRYCYHPGLSIVGQCRICLVEIERMPKLQVACHTPATDGMVVHTNSDKVLEARRAVLEFLLVNHPLDCPVCDQAGECWLQNYYMQHGQHDSQVVVDKVKKHKAQPIGPNVMLDSERCILCTRCVRFCDEVTATHELGIFNRGDHSELAPYPGVELANNYSGNTVDICPVGALTDRDFRFKTRVWYLNETPSICPGCSTGCNIVIHHNDERTYKADGARVARLKPRYNAEVNQWWMCDTGRYGFDFVDAESRLLRPRKRLGSELEILSWRKAMQAVAMAISETVRKYGPDSVAVVLSPQMANEDLFLGRELFSNLIGLANLAFEVPKLEPEEGDALLMTADRNPNSKGGWLLGLPHHHEVSLATLLQVAREKEVRGLYICHHDLGQAVADKELEAAFSQLDFLIFQGSNSNMVSEKADYVLPSTTFAERDGTFTSHAGRVQRFCQAVAPLGDSKPDWLIFKSLAKALGHAMPYFEAEDVFAALADEEAAFAGLDYGSIGESGAQLSPGAETKTPAKTKERESFF